MDSKLFGSELRKLRRAANLTLADVAAAVGKSVVYVSQLETGDRSPPSPALLRAILERFAASGEFERMFVLAIQCRQFIEIELKDKSPAEVAMFASLARRSSDGELSPEVIEQITRLFDQSEKPKS